MSKEEFDNVVTEVENRHPYKVKGNYETYGPYNEGWSDACDILGQKLFTFLSEQLAEKEKEIAKLKAELEVKEIIITEYRNLTAALQENQQSYDSTSTE